MDDSSYVRHGEGISNSKGEWLNTVVPHTDRLFECSFVDIRKYRFHGEKEYRKIVEPLLEGGSSVYVLGSEISDETPMEFLMIWMTDKQGVIHAIAGIDVIAYAMSEDGKTIDKWVCAAGPPSTK